jgi:ATP-dependent Zn protease
MSDDYYYNYDPNMNLTFNDDIYYGNFPTEVDLYNKVVKVDTERKQSKKVSFTDKANTNQVNSNQTRAMKMIQKNNSQPDMKMIQKNNSQPDMEMVQKKKQEGGVLNTSMLCLLLLLTILFTMWRYGLIGMAIDRGATLPALALLTPEIGNAVYLAAL